MNLSALCTALLGLVLLSGTALAQRSPPADNAFAALAARELHQVASFSPPEFALTAPSETSFVFYGKGPGLNQFEEVRCERNAGFEFIAKANLTGSLRVGVCAREAQRIRDLSVAAKASLEALIQQLSLNAKVDAAQLVKLGWTYSRQPGENGAEEHYFAVIAVGHGLLAAPTVVLVPRGARQAIVVQADVSKLCENYGLQDKTALCRDTRQALTDIARRVHARAPQ